MKITVKKGDITTLAVGAIVNPANSRGLMGGGVAGVIKRVGGQEIEEEAVAKAPIAVGEAVLTTACKLPCKHVIHAPTMEQPAMKIDVENVTKAVNAALKCAEEHKLRSIAFPGMGTGVGGVAYKDAAEAMIAVIKQFSTNYIYEVLLVAYNDELFNAFKEVL